jgi:N-acetylmuramoyl-L-alanine amidase
MRVRVWLLSIVLPVSAGAAELRDVRVWAGPESTRVVFDLDSLAEHSLFTLSNPERIVIDLADTHRARTLLGKLAGKGIVQQLRNAAHENGTLRVVLDLTEAAKSKSFSLQPNESYGFRVVVDLFSEAQTLAQAQARTSPPRAAPAEKPIIIAVDAGHGGEDPGARGHGGLWEKDVALSLARRLASLVNQEKGFRAVLIRDGDYYLDLRERSRKAREAQADLFVSIHANSYQDRNVRGTAVYVLSPKGASSEHANILANRENRSDLIGGVDINAKDDTTNAVLIDILQTSAMEASYDVGSRLLSSMSRVNVLQRPKVQQASFVVLKLANMPSVLVETAFLTNAREERLLADPVYQESMARSMLDGIKGYFESYRPDQQVAQQAGPAGSLQAVSLAR